MRRITYSFLLLSAILVHTGCGGKDEDVSLTPPPAPSTGVSLAPAADAAPQTAQTPAPDASAPPPAAAADPFKDMSAEKLEELKAAGFTPETHDLNLSPLTEAINGFFAEYKRLPATQEELVKARYLNRVLYPPVTGKKYVIDQKTGEVSAQ